MSILDRVLDVVPELPNGSHAVVVCGVNGDAWHTGRSYATPAAAFGVATRHNTETGSAYVVKRHRGGTTVYLSATTVLGTRPA